MLAGTPCSESGVGTRGLDPEHVDGCIFGSCPRQKRYV